MVKWVCVRARDEEKDTRRLSDSKRDNRNETSRRSWAVGDQGMRASCGVILHDVRRILLLVDTHVGGCVRAR